MIDGSEPVTSEFAAIQISGAVALATGIKQSALQTTLRVLTQLCARFEASERQGDEA
jgi:hypothetical protein